MLSRILARATSSNQPNVKSLFDRLLSSFPAHSRPTEQATAVALFQARFYRSSTQKQHGTELALDLEDPSLLPKVALIGRPNVGKSALFNRLIRRRAALVYDTPESHVTRDWKEETARLGDLVFRVADTAGVEPLLPTHTVQARANYITARMLQSTHMVLMVVDARAGIVGADQALAEWLRRSYDSERVLLVANKAEGAAARAAMDQTVADSFRLGFGEPVAVSATTGEGLSDLFVALQPHLDAVRRKLVSEAGIDPDTVSLTRSTRPPRTQDSSTGAVAASSTLEDDGSDSEMESSLMGQGAAQEDDAGVGPSKATAVGTATTSTGSDTIRMAIMGLPNAGKSTLINQLIGEERTLAGPEPGLTRDVVAIDMEHNGRTFRLVDTAGYVGQTKVSRYDDVGGEVADMARNAGLRALAAAQVVVLVTDAAAAVDQEKVLSSRELGLLGRVVSEGKGVVIAANKMDLVPGATARRMYLSTLRKSLAEAFTSLGAPEVVEMVASSGKGVKKLLPAVELVHRAWDSRTGTGRLNAIVRQLLGQTRGSGGASYHLARIKYITQVHTRPPTFAVFMTGSSPVEPTFERYLGDKVRVALGLYGVPLRFWFRYKQRRSEWKVSLPGQQSASAKAGAGGRTWLEGKPVVAPWQYMRQRAAIAAKESGGLSEYDASRVEAELSEARRSSGPSAPGSGAASQSRGSGVAAEPARRSAAEALEERRGREKLRQLTERASLALERARAEALESNRDAAESAGAHHMESRVPALPSTSSSNTRQPVAAVQAHNLGSTVDGPGSGSRHSDSGSIGPRARDRPSPVLKLSSAQQHKGLSKGKVWAAYMQSVHRSPSAPLVPAAPRKRQEARSSRQARAAGWTGGCGHTGDTT